MSIVNKVIAGIAYFLNYTPMAIMSYFIQEVRETCYLNTMQEFKVLSYFLCQFLFPILLKIQIFIMLHVLFMLQLSEKL